MLPQPRPPAVPIGPPPSYPAGRSGPPIWAFILGGCAVALVLVIGLAVLGTVFFTRNFEAGKYSCLPSDFPVYPGASYQGVHNVVGTGGSVCSVTVDTAATASQAQDYYQTRLAAGNWKVTGYDASQGVMSFDRPDSARVHGTIAFLSHGTRTQLNIELDS